MASPDDARRIVRTIGGICELLAKAKGRSKQSRFASAVKALTVALEAARALPHTNPDCLVVARVQVMLADANAHLLATAGPVFSGNLSDGEFLSAFLEPYRAACHTLERRRIAGTLGVGCCAPQEAVFEMLLDGLGVFASSKVDHASAPDLDARAILFGAMHPAVHGDKLGYLTFLGAAFHSAAMIAGSGCKELDEASNDVDSFAVFCRAVELIVARHAEGILPTICSDEVNFFNSARSLLQVRFVNGERGEAVRQAWMRLLASCGGRRIMAVADTSFLPVDPSLLDQYRELRESLAARNAARGLRRCGLASCNACEIEPLQFSKCGACKAVVYCCREHQVQDWSQHKAACKAARKAAEQNASSGR